MVSTLLFLASLVTAVCTKPIVRSTTMVLADQRTSIPSGFVQQKEEPGASQTLQLRINLAQSNLAGLEKALYDASTPTSAKYGQHLTKEQVQNFVSPSKETASLVTSWLSQNGIQADKLTPAGDWLNFTLPVNKANALLKANYSSFKVQSSEQTILRTLSYSIPSNLVGHINAIHPTTAFDVIKLPTAPIIISKSNNSSSSANATISNGTGSSSNSTSNITPNANIVDASCDQAVTPACIQELYGIPSTPATQSSNVLGVSGFVGQFASTTDLQSFLGVFRPDVTTTFGLQTVDGGINDEANPGTEASLDIQYTIGIATDVPTNFISVGSDNTDGISGFLDIINFLMTDPPNVLSTSYGFDETDISADIANSLCNAYMQLTALGTSIIFSSGDGGVGGSTPGESCSTFIPTFPSGCPYVTSVGATTGTVETAASFSSGGFSNIFPQPAYQQAAVASYLTTLGSTDANDFNVTGRAFPDVSAQGSNVQIIVNGVQTTVAGTSCSAPIFASIIALLNDQRIAAGLGALGFLNPLLYSNPTALNDIVTGDNPGCGTNGFPAATGWDPVTGLGTPNFNNLKAVASL